MFLVVSYSLLVPVFQLTLDGISDVLPGVSLTLYLAIIDCGLLMSIVQQSCRLSCAVLLLVFVWFLLGYLPAKYLLLGLAAVAIVQDECRFCLDHKPFQFHEPRQQYPVTVSKSICGWWTWAEIQFLLDYGWMCSQSSSSGWVFSWELTNFVTWIASVSVPWLYCWRFV